MPKPLTTNFDALLKTGRLTQRLITHQSWIVRREECVEHRSATDLRRTIKLVADRDVLRSYAREAFGSLPRTIDIPLALLPKVLPIGSEITDGAGIKLARLASDEDSDRALGALVAALVDEGGYSRSTLPEEFIELLYGIAINKPSEADIETVSYAPAGFVEAWSLPQEGGEDRAKEQAWEDLFQVIEFSNLLATFTTSYMPLVRLSLAGPREATVIFSYSETQTRARRQSRAELRSCTMLSEVEVPGLGFGSRDQIEFPAPPGTFFETVLLWEARSVSRDPFRELTPTESSRTYTRRVTPTRAQIHVKGIDVGQYSVIFSLRPRRAGLIRQSMLAVGVAALILLFGGFAEMFGKRLSPVGAPKEAMVVLLLLIPTGLLGFLATNDEHEMLSTLLAWPRILIGCVVVANISAAAALIAEFKGYPLAGVWLGAALASALVFADLVRVYRSSRFAEDAVLATSDEDTEPTITVFL